MKSLAKPVSLEAIKAIWAAKIHKTLGADAALDFCEKKGVKPELVRIASTLERTTPCH